MDENYKSNLKMGKLNDNPLNDITFIPTDKIENKKREIKKEEESKLDEEDTAPPISFWKLYRYSTGKDQLMIFLGVLGACVTGLTSPANTFIFGDLADAMIDHGISIAVNGTDNNEGFLEAVNSFASNNSIIGAVMLIFSYISITLFNYAANSQIFRIRGIFFRSALNQDISYYDFNQSGEFASRMNEDLTKMEEGLGEKVVMFVHFIVAFFGSIILAFIKGWKLALVCLSSLPVTFISMGLVAFVTSRLAKSEMDEYGKAGAIAEEVLGAIRTVIAFNGQNKEIERYSSNLSNAKKLNIKKGFFSGLGFGLLWFFIYGSYGLAFWYGVGLVLEDKGSEEIVYTPGVMFTVFFSVMVGAMNLGMASPYIEAFGVAKGAGAKIFSVIENIPKINPLMSSGKQPKKCTGNINFRDVHFEYRSRPDVKILQGINITINRGETVALVGSSGCGKSTCIQLLQRFYDPSIGAVFLDDLNIKDLNVNWLRKRIGVVGQEPVLFGTSIFENIRYGKEDADKEEIVNAAKAANAHNFIKKLPMGYETLVGERGAQLSGGQKQRIAIARALVRNPDILLLDEATSALDTASEAKVQVALEKASQGRTTIIVAHRLSTIRNADKIIVIHEGKVVESGDHDKLMALKSFYYNLVTTQIGEEDDKVRTPSATDMPPNFRALIDDDDADVGFIMENEVKEDENNKQKNVPLLSIIKLNAKEWPYILIGSISSIIMGFAMPLFAILFGDIMGVLSNTDDDFIRSETNKFSLYFILAGIVVGVATFLQISTFGIAGEILTEKLRRMAFSAMLKQEIGWFDDKQNGTGTLCAKLSNDAAAVQGATGQRVGTILQSVATLLLAVGLSMYYEWKLGLLALVFTPFILVATYLQHKVMVEENLGSTKAMEQCTKLAVEVISSIRTVVSLGREKMFYSQYISFLSPSVQKAKRNTHYRGFVYGIARSLMFFAFAACMFYGGYLVVNEGLNFELVFKVSQALIMGSVSIASALAFAPNFQKGVTAASNIFALLNRIPQIQDPPNVKDEKWNSDGHVYYDSVMFSYPSRLDTLVLKSLSLEVSVGQKVALVGPSGCGKSTCIQLLQRFYDADDGLVSIDKQDVRNVLLKSLRLQMGTVSQEPSLFDRTIAENIAYGDNTRLIDQNEIIEVAKKANIHNFITSLPMGYETRLGEKGTQLSGGQKQRVAIARALIRNPKILLLDEATSALDTESEKIVQDALDVASEGRTCITIAHRLSTIVDSDIIFVLDGGIVAESGTHKELLSKRGIYYSLYKLQSGSRSTR